MFIKLRTEAPIIAISAKVVNMLCMGCLLVVTGVPIERYLERKDSERTMLCPRNGGLATLFYEHSRERKAFEGSCDLDPINFLLLLITLNLER